MADADTVGVWNAASASARQLHTQGVCARDLTKQWKISCAVDNILRSIHQQINPNVGNLVAEHSVVGHLPCTKTAMNIPTMPQHGSRCQENLPNGSCCQTSSMSHAVQLDKKQQDLQDAHFISLGTSSNVPGSQQSAIINGSLNQRPSALEPRLLSSKQPCNENDRKSRVRAHSGPYSHGRTHSPSRVAEARPKTKAEAGSLCRLCSQKPAASDLGYPECWECFFGIRR